MLAATARNKRGKAAIEQSIQSLAIPGLDRVPSHEVREKRPFLDK